MGKARGQQQRGTGRGEAGWSWHRRGGPPLMRSRTRAALPVGRGLRAAAGTLPRESPRRRAAGTSQRSLRYARFRRGRSRSRVTESLW